MIATERHGLGPDRGMAWMARLGALALAAALSAAAVGCADTASDSASSGELWGTNTVTPAAFVKELSNSSGADRPIVVCTAPAVLYRVGHIPGAVLHGPTGSPDGLEDLKTWAGTLPRSANLVLYCGCCPLNECPNLRPAYFALRNLGFTRARVLIMPDSFWTDWVQPGYPVEK